MTQEQLVKRIRQATKRTSISEVAREMQVSPSNLSGVLAGRMEPGRQILKHMGIVRVVTYKLEAK